MKVSHLGVVTLHEAPGLLDMKVVDVFYGSHAPVAGEA
jgi:hypothetical protein